MPRPAAAVHCASYLPVEVQWNPQVASPVPLAGSQAMLQIAVDNTERV